jgi:regulatory protein
MPHHTAIFLSCAGRGGVPGAVPMPLKRPRTSLSPEDRASVAAARLVALRLLAGRDFAAAELQGRLTSRGFEANAAQAVIEEFTASGALNEARYAHNYVSWHAGRGQGPLRIAADLRRQGVEVTLVAAALAEQADWADLARRLCRAKFGARTPTSWREKARQMRFLQYRGFSADHIRAATGADPDWTEDLE